MSMAAKTAEAATAMTAERFARLQLIRTSGVGPVSWRQLMHRFGSARAAISALPDLARRGGARRFALAPRSRIIEELEWVANQEARHIFLNDSDYPALLAETEGAPAALIVKGDLGLLDKTIVAIVGARNASAIACRFSREIAAQMAADDLLIVSGLARGIDTAAHVGAMACGATAAVIASGIDIAFPSANAALQERIASEQLLITEHPPRTEPIARHFPSRNRIIAGLAEAVVVVEAASKSGSLITARRAADFGREILAVPGSPLDPRARGCNQLIRDGATLIQTVDDIYEALRPIDSRMVRQPLRDFHVADSDSDEQAAQDEATEIVEVVENDRCIVANLLGVAPVAVDEVVRQSGLSSAAVQLVLLELELAERIVRHAAARVSLR